jgi:hypothetical protein
MADTSVLSVWSNKMTVSKVAGSVALTGTQSESQKKDKTEDLGLKLFNQDNQPRPFRQLSGNRIKAFQIPLDGATQSTLETLDPHFLGAPPANFIEWSCERYNHGTCAQIGLSIPIPRSQIHFRVTSLETGYQNRLGLSIPDLLQVCFLWVWSEQHVQHYSFGQSASHSFVAFNPYTAESHVLDPVSRNIFPYISLRPPYTPSLLTILNGVLPPELIHLTAEYLHFEIHVVTETVGRGGRYWKITVREPRLELSK